MKRMIALLLVMVMALSLAACGNDNKTTGETTPAETTPAETTAAPVEIASAVELLQNVYNAYNADVRPPLAGGAGDAMNWEGPGAISATDTDSLSYYLLVPADQMSSFTDVASMMHAMNQNNMTVGAFKVTGDAKAFADAMANAVVNNQWVCGFPEKVAFYSVGEYVVMFYGKAGVDDPEFGDFLTPFATALTTAYPTATLIVEQNLM